MAVQISSERGSHAVATLDKRLFLFPQLLQVLRYLTGHRLADHHRCLGTDPLHLAPGELLLTFFLTEPRDHIRRATIGPYAIGVGSRALQQEADLPESFDRIHGAGTDVIAPAEDAAADVPSAWPEPPSPSRNGRRRAETSALGAPRRSGRRRSRRGCDQRNSTT